MSPRPRVLLVEDDPSLQRFVALALEDLGIELIAIGGVDAALAELAREPVDLILTDLMLPGRSGFELIEALAADPSLRGRAELLVFSAGLNPATRQRLARARVGRLLSKPCSVAELERSVRAALPQTPPSAPNATAADDAIARHFGGHRRLYELFRSSCHERFPQDLAEGDGACAATDAQGMRRLAHSLKSVLQLLGHAQLAELAARLELRAERGDWPGIASHWADLRQGLRGLLQAEDRPLVRV